MNPPDFRALCAELLQGLDENRHPEVRYPGHLRIVMADARTALAQPVAPDRLRQCPTHGQQLPNAWGCPECVRELRELLENLRHIAARHVDEVDRCPGEGSWEDGEWDWREGCEDCLRRTSPGGRVTIQPPQIIAFECEHRIAPGEINPT
jgi:hypothetical protein